MTIQQLRQNLLQLVKLHFGPKYNVYYADEKRTRPQLPIVTLKLKNAGMTTHPNEEWRDGATVKSHSSTAMLEINLFTPGAQADPDAGRDAYQNSACDELTGFCHYLEYPATEVFLFQNDLAVELEGKVLDVTAILDGIEPEFRAMAEFTVDFTQTVTDPNAKEFMDGCTCAGGSAGRNENFTGYFTSVEITETEE